MSMIHFDHVFETVPRQLGAAFFIAGHLVGVEVAPTVEVWRELAPILNIYCYGPAALLAEQEGYPSGRAALELDGLVDLDDLADRLDRSRRQHAILRSEALGALADAEWSCQEESVRHGLLTKTIGWETWAGQVVLDGSYTSYLSIFRDLPPRKPQTVEADRPA